MTMQIEKFYVGVDVSKPVLDVYIRPTNKKLQFNNDGKGHREFLKIIKGIQPELITLEATGGYEKAVTKALQAKSFPVSVVNPRQVRDFAKSLGRLAKTDGIDAEVIALFGEKIQPEPRLAKDIYQEKLSGLHIRRQQVVDMLTMEKNRAEKLEAEFKKEIERHVEYLEKSLRSINKALQEAVRSNPDHLEKAKRLETISGVGETTAIGIVAQLPELGTLDAKKISALVGVAPFNCDSGSMRGKRRTWGGRGTVRKVLYMATLVATQRNEKIKVFYQRLCGSGKSKKAALIACMHKLLIIMNAMIKNGEDFMMQS